MVSQEGLHQKWPSLPIWMTVIMDDNDKSSYKGILSLVDKSEELTSVMSILLSIRLYVFYRFTEQYKKLYNSDVILR